MEDCIFCKIVRGEAPSWKVMESEKAYAFLDINPVSRYHTLVIPKGHYQDIFDVPKDDLKAVMDLLHDVCQLYRDKLGIHNLQIVSSSGAEAQQDVFHLHFHIVPRRRGDGQNIRWRTHPEWRTDFDGMLEKLEMS
ncbi:MAG: HIT family protein [Bacteroidota bacterium]